MLEEERMSVGLKLLEWQGETAREGEEKEIRYVEKAGVRVEG